MGAGTKIKHIQRFGGESHSFDSWQGESREDCSTERKMTCKFPIQNILQNASRPFERHSIDGDKHIAPQFSITFHKI